MTHHLRRLLAPLAVAAMLLGLAGNAAAQTDTAPDFGTATIVDQNYIVNRAITPLTLPTATGGEILVLYALTPALPAGLTFEPTGRVLSGTPTTIATAVEYTYEADDSDGNRADSDKDTLTFTITVAAAPPPTGLTLSVDPAAVPESSTATDISLTATFVGGTFAVERVIAFFTGTSGTASAGADYMPVGFTNLTIPANTASATATFSFTAHVDTAAEPAGETVDITAGLYASGNTMPFDNSISVTLATITINDPVAGDLSPDFAADASIADQSFVVGETVALALPGIISGTGNISIHYTLTPALPAGLTFNAGVRPQPTITGSPTAAAASAEYTYTVTDGDTNTARTDTDMLTFSITVTENLVPTFGDATLPDLLNLTFNSRFEVFLPLATGGNGALTYRLFLGGTHLCVNCSFNGARYFPSSRSVRVRLFSTIFLGEGQTFHWIANDADGDSADEARLTFRISSTKENLVPAFADGANIANQSYLENSPITALTLPTATGGNGPTTYTLTPAIPGLTLNPNTGILTGTPTAAAASAEYTYTANDRDGDRTTGDTATLTFNAVVAADLVPTLGTATIADQSFMVGDTVALTLPGVTPGTGNISIAYTLTPALPAGLTFNGNLRPPTITGSPTAAAASAEYTYMVTDGDANTAPSDTDMRTFTITVEADTAPAFADDAMIPGQFYYAGQVLDLTLPQATGGNGALTYTLTGPGGEALATALPGAFLNPTTRVLFGTPIIVAAKKGLHLHGDRRG